VRNRDLHFVCDRVSLRVERTDLPWTQNYQSGQVITLPIAHGEGCYFADADTLKQLEDNRQVVFRYCSASGEIGESTNVNGSLHNIAGICNAQGNVLGMMPHPERAADKLLGCTDGLHLFESVLSRLMAIA
jgi:phosphoribosylformylglycinamidine synthase